MSDERSIVLTISNDLRVGGTGTVAVVIDDGISVPEAFIACAALFRFTMEQSHSGIEKALEDFEASVLHDVRKAKT